jgi:hypothetical protein
MQSPSYTREPLVDLGVEPAWKDWLVRNQRTIALAAAAFVAGVAVGAGGRRPKTAVAVRIHNQFPVRNEGTMGLIVRAARGR